LPAADQWWFPFLEGRALRGRHAGPNSQPLCREGCWGWNSVLSAARSRHARTSPELSNNIIQKRLAFDRDWSATCAHSRPKRRPEIPPRWLYRRCGASVVRRDAASTERRISMSTVAKKSSPASKLPVVAAKPSLTAPDDIRGPKAPGSKQSRVIAMLQSPTGTTIAAMMKTTGWQQHSVRGFLAGVVRKRRKVKRSSKKVDGNRIYRIAGASHVKTGARSSSPSP
jgi:hypothetical protein